MLMTPSIISQINNQQIMRKDTKRSSSMLIHKKKLVKQNQTIDFDNLNHLLENYDDITEN